MANLETPELALLAAAVACWGCTEFIISTLTCVFFFKLCSFLLFVSGAMLRNWT
jgi:hypothetical protein